MEDQPITNGKTSVDARGANYMTMLSNLVIITI